MARLLVVVTGFGPPHLDVKQRLLQSNIERIRNTFTGDVTVKLFNYGGEPCDFPLVNEEIMTPGYVGQFLYRYVPPSSVTEYDYIICILDDIELHTDYNVDRAIRNIKQYNLDILQPSLTLTSKFSHRPMLQDSHNTAGIRMTTFMEYFCYLMTPTGYAKWYSMFDEHTAWLWGVDLCMNKRGILMGLLDATPMHHYFQGEAYSPTRPNPYHEMERVLKRYNGVHSVHGVYKAIHLPYIQ
jgi:hypothetical protein